MPEPSTSRTIPMDNRTKRFYQGAATADEVTKAHAEVDFPDELTRAKMFFFYAGVLAVSKHECSTSEDLDNFLLGLNTRAPSGVDEMRDR